MHIPFADRIRSCTPLELETFHNQALSADANVRQYSALTKEHPFLQPGFVFYGKWYDGNSRVVSVDVAKNSLTVELYRPGGHSHIEDDWNLAHYLHGFEEGSYLPMKVRPLEAGQLAEA